MIVFELICADRHRFEGWFASAGDFEGQKGRGLLSCPVCGASKVEKLLTAKGVTHTFTLTDGRHEWTVWRHQLNDIAPLLFK